MKTTHLLFWAAASIALGLAEADAAQPVTKDNFVRAETDNYFAGFVKAFGTQKTTDPSDHLIGTARGWGGNPVEGALYISGKPKADDGKTVHRLTVKDVPVDGFWSISVYNKDGFFEPNPQNAYSLNNVTAKKGADGAYTIQFGGCDGKIPNCLPIMPGWNYTVRLYRPRAAVLDGTWKFPEAQPA